MNAFIHWLLPVWAFVVGLSVAVQATFTNHLNSASDLPLYHAFYIACICVCIGGIMVTPSACCSSPSWGTPRKLPLLSGLCTLPSFIQVWASRGLGLELMLLGQLLGLSSTFLFFDFVEGNVKPSDKFSLMGFAITVFGIFVNTSSSSAIPDGNDGSDASCLKVIVEFVGVYISGIGFALQSKLNGLLAADLGTAPRAAMVSSIVSFSVSLPIVAYIYLRLDVPFVFDKQQLPLWIGAGFQSGFYMASMAILPRMLGFTATYMVALAGKLSTGLIIDTFGLTGRTIEISYLRCMSVGCVLVGATVFRACKSGGAEPGQLDANNALTNPLAGTDEDEIT